MSVIRLVANVGASRASLAVFRGDQAVTTWHPASETWGGSDLDRAQLLAWFSMVRGLYGTTGETIVGPTLSPLSSAVVEASDTILHWPVRFIGDSVARRWALRGGGPRHLDFDRLLACAGAWRRFGASIVVGVGPVTSLDVIDPDGEHLSGVVAPGFPDAISASEFGGPSSRRPASSRAEELRYGLEYGAAAIIYELLAKLRGQWPQLRRLQVVATGRLAQEVASACAGIDRVEPLLGLDGLRRIGEIPGSAVLTQLQLPAPKVRIQLLRADEPDRRKPHLLPIVVDELDGDAPYEAETNGDSSRLALTRPGTPRALRRAASRGALPMRPRDLVATQFDLIWDPDPDIAGTADRALTVLHPHIAKAVLSDPTVPPAVLGELTRRNVDHDAFLQPLLINRATPVEAVAIVARICSEPMAEIIGNDHERLLERPDLVLALAANPAALRSTVHRAVDFLVRSGIFIEAREFHESRRRIGGDPDAVVPSARARGRRSPSVSVLYGPGAGAGRRKR